MTETSTSPAADAVVRYLQFWNTEPDDQRRMGPELFTDDVAYIAPVGVLAGVEALAGFTEQFLDGVGAYEFRTRVEPDIHHDRARVQWEIRVGDVTFAEGTDILAVEGEGRIESVTTFVDRAPQGVDLHEHHGPTVAR